jgi:hypothetical protein
LQGFRIDIVRARFINRFVIKIPGIE